MRALVIGASGGIGGAVCGALRGRGWQVVGLSRSADGLDVTDEASVARVLGAVEGPLDLIFVATGGLEVGGFRPEKSVKALDGAAMAAQFALNAIGPALVLKHVWRMVPRDRPARVAVLSARVGSIGDNRLGGWHGYRAAKAALNQILRTCAVELARTHPQAALVALHPGTVATSLTAAYAGGHPTVTPEVAAENLLRVLEDVGPAQSGQFFDWKGEVVPW
jgi:NAD(P)-dependent dehydrogenase (short-subunit alcohol dehydrogenase family)